MAETIDTARRVSPDALAEADELWRLVTTIYPHLRGGERVDRIARAFGWASGTTRAHLLAVYLYLRADQFGPSGRFGGTEVERHAEHGG